MEIASRARKGETMNRYEKTEPINIINTICLTADELQKLFYPEPKSSKDDTDEMAFKNIRRMFPLLYPDDDETMGTEATNMQLWIYEDRNLIPHVNIMTQTRHPQFIREVYHNVLEILVDQDIMKMEIYGDNMVVAISWSTKPVGRPTHRNLIGGDPLSMLMNLHEKVIGHR